MQPKPKFDGIHVATLGLPRAIGEALAPSLAAYKNTVIPSFTRLDNLIEDQAILSPCPHLLVCGPPPISVDILEFAQVLRMLYPKATIFYACPSRDGYDRKLLIGNGFTDTFLLPMDHETIKGAIQDALSASTEGAVKAYRPVKLIDIEPGKTLDFETSIYLPVNNKYIPYSAAGDPLDAERAEQLVKHKIDSVFVKLQDMDKFYGYTANSLKNILHSKKLSATERNERMQRAVRELMTGIFNDTLKDSSFETGRSVLKDCREIVKNYVEETPSGDWYKKLLNLSTNGGTTYSHASDVSAYAALFSMGLGVGDPEEMAMAGILHDIGMADVPLTIQVTPEDVRSADEHSIYKRHPEFSLDMLQRKKLLLPPKVSKAILQHHESYNGSGYPRGISGDRICPEAQLLKLADTFDYLTTLREGTPKMNAREALEYFRKQLEGDEKNLEFDPVLLKNFLELFSASEKL